MNFFSLFSVATVSFAGAYAGTVVAMPLSGILASAWGWESLFYFFGKTLQYFFSEIVVQ